METNTTITVVCGFGRCGSSAMMGMLHAGGMPVHAQYHGSFEHEDMLRLPHHTAWLTHCQGKAVKVLNPHTSVLPQGHVYDFIFVDRAARDMARSHAKFLKLLEGIRYSNTELNRFERNLIRDRDVTLRLLKGYPESRLLVARFAEIVTQPERVARQVAEFVAGRQPEGRVERLNIENMAASIIRRSPSVYPGMLELKLLERNQ